MTVYMVERVYCSECVRFFFVAPRGEDKSYNILKHAPKMCKLESFAVWHSWMLLKAPEEI